VPPQPLPIPKHGDFKSSVVPGTIARMPSAVFKNMPILVKYRFRLSSPCSVRVMFNTPENCRVWLDNEFAFGRECGRMAPSFHRAPINQYKDVLLAAGVHELLAAIDCPPPQRQIAQWVVGIGDAATMQWIPDVFKI
jgi:hypothetical protein